jgi:hypothetical protein
VATQSSTQPDGKTRVSRRRSCHQPSSLPLQLCPDSWVFVSGASPASMIVSTAVMSAPSEFEAIVDSPRNLARVRFAGAFTAATMQAAAAKVEALLPVLQPGFSLLADFSQLSGIDLESVPHLTRIMDLCRARGIGFIVRILPARKYDIGINLLAVVHYRGEVKTVTVDTLAEAERALS